MYSKHKWESENYFNFCHLEYLPKDYDETKEYPLVFFLHVAGERGDNLDLIATKGYMRYVPKGYKFFNKADSKKLQSGEYLICKTDCN